MIFSIFSRCYVYILCLELNFSNWKCIYSGSAFRVQDSIANNLVIYQAKKFCSRDRPVKQYETFSGLPILCVLTSRVFSNLNDMNEGFLKQAFLLMEKKKFKRTLSFWKGSVSRLRHFHAYSCPGGKLNFSNWILICGHTRLNDQISVYCHKTSSCFSEIVGHIKWKTV